MALAEAVSAQPVCSISIGNDTTICTGESVLLTGPAGFSGHVWSTGETTPSITVSSAGTYSCQVSYPTGNLVTNGNFSSGNMGFNTMFNHGTPLTTEGNYWIGTNAALYHPQFQGTGNGQFLMVNAGWMHSGWRFWCQTIDVCPGQTYVISFRAASLATTNPPVLAWFVNNVWTGLEHTPPAAQGQWQNFNLAWTAPAGTTSAEFCIQVSSGWGVGNDFGFDDVDIRSTVVLSDQVQVNVTPLPQVDLGPDITLCDGQSITLDVATPGGSYLWQDGSTASSIQVSSAGTYSVDVMANGCSASDAMNVSYNPLPVVDLGPDLSLCTGQTVVLDVTQPGASYGWNTGSTASAITVSGPGTYGVTVFQGNCFASDVVDVAYNPFPTVNIGPDAILCAGDQVTFDATTPGATYLWNDGSTGPTFTATATGPVNVDVTVNSCTTTDAANVQVNPYPFFDLGPNLTVCPGTVLPLTVAIPGATFLWQDGSTASTFNAIAPGTYSVAVTLNGCTTNDAITISNHTLPVVDLGADLSICAGTSANLNVNLPGATFLWNNGATTNTIAVNSAGTYTVAVTLNGCTVSDAVNVAVTPLPSFDPGPDQLVCPGATTTLDATVPGATYAWNTGANTPTITVGPGTYAVTVTANNCSASADINVGLHPGATVELGNDTTLCPGQDLVLNATQPGATYLWQNGSTASTLLANSAGAYSITLTDVNGCMAQDVINVNYTTPQAIDLGPNIVICAGSAVVLDATVPGATYLWNSGASTPTLAVNSGGTYSVTVTEGTCTTTDAITVQVSPLPVVDLGSDTTLCPGATLSLTGPIGNSLLWSTGATGPAITVSAAGNYTLTATNADGCFSTDAITVNYAAPITIDLGADRNICAGSAVTLDATVPGATYLWSTGATTPTITVSTAGTYSVDVLQGTCSVTDAITITVDPTPVFDLGPAQVLCQGESVTLNASVPGATYVWSTGATTPTITASNTGTYSATAFLNGCTFTDQIQLTVLSPSAVDLGPDQVRCQGEVITLDATVPGATYLWSTGATTPTITIMASANDSYSVQVIQGACSVSDAVNITVTPLPTLELGADEVICEGTSTILNATFPGATYVWNTGASTPTITVSTSGTYSVTVDLDGCTVQDAVIITTLSPDAVDLGPNTQLCIGETITLNAGLPGATHAWSTGATTATITTGVAGTYWVNATQGSCAVADTILITVVDPGVLDLGDDATLCDGEVLQLDISLPGATYLWNDGSTEPTRSITDPGAYSLVATVQGCSVEDSITVAFNPVPIVDLGPNVSLCPGDELVLQDPTPGATYLWSTGSTAETIAVAGTGTYTLAVTLNNCTSSDAVDVTVVQGPVVELGADTTLCDGQQLTFNLAQPGASFLWNDGITTAQRMIAISGSYSVTVTRNGCTRSDTIVVQFFDPAVVDLGPDQRLCPGESTTLMTAVDADLLWSTGGNGSSIVVNSPGTYWVEASGSGCVVRDSVRVSYVPLVAPVLPQLSLGCAGDTLTLAVENNGATVLWSDGSTADSLRVSASGLYSVSLSLEGCVASTAALVELLPLVIELPAWADSTFCPGEELRLNAEVPFANYVWSTGDNGPTLMVPEVGNYAVTVTTACATAERSIFISDGECSPLVNVPNAFTPDGDGINDVFFVSLSAVPLVLEWSIFNRWGTLIFESSDPQAQWDGTYQGQPAPQGVYVYQLTYRKVAETGVVAEKLRGHVTLVR